MQSWKPKDDVSSERWHMANCRHFFKKNSENISIGKLNYFSAAWRSGSERRFYDGLARKVGGSTTTKSRCCVH